MLKNICYAWLTFNGLFLVSSPPLQKNQQCINEVLFMQQADSIDEASLKYAGLHSSLFCFCSMSCISEHTPKTLENN